MEENLEIKVIEQNNEKLDVYKLMWLFGVASLIGFSNETLWCYFKYGMIASRKGVIYGPFTPIYGFGAVILILALYNYRNKNIVYIFSTTAIIGAAFEYVASLFQETLFGSVSWDYESKYVSFGGRTSLLYAVFWGILGICLIKVVYPLFNRAISRYNQKIIKYGALTICIFFSINLFISAAAVYRQSERKSGKEADNLYERFLDQKYPDSFLEKVYPNMKFVK